MHIQLISAYASSAIKLIRVKCVVGIHCGSCRWAGSSKFCHGERLLFLKSSEAFYRRFICSSADSVSLVLYRYHYHNCLLFAFSHIILQEICSHLTVSFSTAGISYLALLTPMKVSYIISRAWLHCDVTSCSFILYSIFHVSLSSLFTSKACGEFSFTCSFPP